VCVCECVCAVAGFSGEKVSIEPFPRGFWRQILDFCVIIFPRSIFPVAHVPVRTTVSVLVSGFAQLGSIV
jgi:hypothetical protein